MTKYKIRILEFEDVIEADYERDAIKEAIVRMKCKREQIEIEEVEE